MNEQAEILTEILRDNCKMDKGFNVEPLITASTIDILCEKRNEEIENGDVDHLAKRHALLDLLLKSRKQDASLTFQDIQEEVDNFLFAGHDTTSATLCWAMQLIGSHPRVQNKIHQELDKILHRSDRYFTNEVLELRHKGNAEVYDSSDTHEKSREQRYQAGRENSTKGHSRRCDALRNSSR